MWNHGCVLTNPYYTCDDVAELYRLIDHNPWATLVTPTKEGLQASHYPVIRDGDVLLTHVGKQDERILELGHHEMLVIVQGPHGYISSAWLPEGEFVPTWNHVSAHLTCEVEILSADENFAVLCELVRRFESHREHPRLLEDYGDAARHAARGTVGLRLVVRSFKMLRKLSQNKTPELVSHLVDKLRLHPWDRHGLLADEMKRAAAGRDSRTEHLQEAVTAGLRRGQQIGYRPIQFMRDIVSDGVITATRKYLADHSTATGLDLLAEKGLLDSSIEAAVILPWFSSLFTADESAEATDRLRFHGFDVGSHQARPYPSWAADSTGLSS